MVNRAFRLPEKPRVSTHGPAVTSPSHLRQPNAWVLESSILDYFAFTDRAVAFKALQIQLVGMEGWIGIIPSDYLTIFNIYSHGKIHHVKER
jgi:hypothetical protein